MNKLRIADLFCGPGGLSEGFQLAGCEVVFGLDNNADAIATFQLNHPNAVTVLEDATKFNSEIIPDFDILVGGPPCVNFSSSKGSRANILDGLRLVQTFLRIVYERKPLFWIMENVPRVAAHLPPTIPLRWIGIDKNGELEVPIRHEFNCANYGVPQSRKRYLIGKYPIPSETHSDIKFHSLFAWANNKSPWVTLSHVLRNLPDPDEKKDGIIVDPNYGFSIPAMKLADHFHTVALESEEADRIKKAKTSHPYMGFMQFPDPIDRPARTVVATQLGRETLVLTTRKPNVYRRATVRECATLQTFPINFYFCGNNLSSRYKQAGDAVPPKLSFAIANEIFKQRGEKEAVDPYINLINEPPAPAIPSSRRQKRTLLSFNKRCCEIVPGKEIRGCRVEFDNKGLTPSRPRFCSKECTNAVEWVTKLHIGEGRLSRKEFPLTISDWVKLLEPLSNSHDQNTTTCHQNFVREIISALVGFVPDATTFQAVYTRRSDAGASPQEVAKLISEKIDKFFPKEKYKRHRLLPTDGFMMLPKKGLLIRIAYAGLASAFACELANHDTRWLTQNRKNRYILDNWPSISVNTILEKEEINLPFHSPSPKILLNHGGQ